jgi:hypothetical protein
MDGMKRPNPRRVARYRLTWSGAKPRGINGLHAPLPCPCHLSRRLSPTFRRFAVYRDRWHPSCTIPPLFYRRPSHSARGRWRMALVLGRKRLLPTLLRTPSDFKDRGFARAEKP